MARFAYLFLAHRDVPVLQAAIDCIDDPRNDVFIHWDLKASEDISTLHAKYSHIYFTERTRCYWGDEQKALYLLFELAHSKGDYLYYHLMTAEEMPIKTQDQIHDSFCGPRQCHGPFESYPPCFSMEASRGLRGSL